MSSSPQCHRRTLILQKIQLRLYTHSNTVIELVVGKEYPLVSNVGDIDDILGDLFPEVGFSHILVIQLICSGA